MLKPGKEIENTIRIINQTMNYASIPYWLCFGGLYALVKNNGVIPDGDFDLCTYYGMDYKRIEKAFKGSPGRYNMSKAIVDDTNQDRALYCSFSSEVGLPHLCLSFWYPHEDKMYYCHDQRHEVTGVGVPKSGYFFRGVPSVMLENKEENFRMAEWPGIEQSAKIRVPRFPGLILDSMYPDWAYKKQMYEVRTGAPVNEEKLGSYHRGGAISPFAVHVQSMNDWGNPPMVKTELENSKKAWDIRIKNGR